MRNIYPYFFIFSFKFQTFIPLKILCLHDMTEEKYTGVSVKPETRRGLRILKAEKGFKSYDDLIREEIFEEQEVAREYIGE